MGILVTVHGIFCIHFTFWMFHERCLGDRHVVNIWVAVAQFPVLQYAFNVFCLALSDYKFLFGELERNIAQFLVFCHALILLCLVLRHWKLLFGGMETNIDNVIPVESQWQLWYLTCCHLNQVIVREHASGFGPTEKVCFLSVHRVLPACNGAPFKCSFPMLWKINCTQRFSLCFLFVIIIIFFLCNSIHHNNSVWL